MRARSLAVATIILGVAGYSNASAQSWGGRPPVGYHQAGNDDKCGHDDDRWNKRGHDRRDGDRDCCDDDRRGDRDRHTNRWGWGDHRDGHGGKDKDDAKDCGGTPAATGTISGKVSGDNGGVSGWTVYLIPQGGSGASATTSADGSYSFGNLAAGTYMVCEADPTPDAEQLPANGSSTLAAPCSTGALFGYSLTLTAGGTLAGINFLNGAGGVAF